MCVKNYRIDIFRRHPHGARGSMLLKMTSILEPDVNIFSASKSLNLKKDAT
jgi:hypothetical protein